MMACHGMTSVSASIGRRKHSNTERECKSSCSDGAGDTCVCPIRRKTPKTSVGSNVSHCSLPTSFATRAARGLPNDSTGIDDIRNGRRDWFRLCGLPHCGIDCGCHCGRRTANGRNRTSRTSRARLGRFDSVVLPRRVRDTHTCIHANNAAMLQSVVRWSMMKDGRRWNGITVFILICAPPKGARAIGGTEGESACRNS